MTRAYTFDELKFRLMKFAKENGLRYLQLQMEYLSEHPKAQLPSSLLGWRETLRCYAAAIEKYTSI